MLKILDFFYQSFLFLKGKTHSGFLANLGIFFDEILFINQPMGCDNLNGAGTIETVVFTGI